MENSVVGAYLWKLSLHLEEILAQSKALVRAAQAVRRSNLVLTMGNGGSSSTAQHLAQGLCDVGVRAICLTDNTALLTALSNDESYEEALSWQVRTYAHNRKSITSVLISASGNSPNILSAARCAVESKAKTIGLTGFGGGKLKELVDISIILSSKDYGIVEDLHLATCHIICKLVQK